MSCLLRLQWNPPPLHFIIRDRSGKSLVIGPIEGELRANEDPVGVLTNSPSFDWHITNLRNYIGLTAHNVPSDPSKGMVASNVPLRAS